MNLIKDKKGRVNKRYIYIGAIGRMTVAEVTRALKTAQEVYVKAPLVVDDRDGTPWGAYFSTTKRSAREAIEELLSEDIVYARYEPHSKTLFLGAAY